MYPRSMFWILVSMLFFGLMRLHFSCHILDDIVCLLLALYWSLLSVDWPEPG